MKLYILRHGKTEWNRLGKVQGCVDIPLAEEGISLAAKVGRALKEVPFDLCFTSPLTRTRQTAELVLGEDVYKRQEKCIRKLRNTESIFFRRMPR